MNTGNWVAPVTTSSFTLMLSDIIALGDSPHMDVHRVDPDDLLALLTRGSITKIERVTDTPMRGAYFRARGEVDGVKFTLYSDDLA